MNKPTEQEFAEMEWGFKFIGTDLCTNDNSGGRFRYHLGEWVEPPSTEREMTISNNPCPSFPGDGLCVAKTLSGAQSGELRIGASVMVQTGFLRDDVLAESTDKIRVRRLFVDPTPIDPVQLLVWGSAMNADLYGADLYGADLSGADLSGAGLGTVRLWLPSRWTVSSNGYIVEA